MLFCLVPLLLRLNAWLCNRSVSRWKHVQVRGKFFVCVDDRKLDLAAYLSEEPSEVLGKGLWPLWTLNCLIREDSKKIS